MAQIQEAAFPRLTGAEIAQVKPLGNGPRLRRWRDPSFEPAKPISIYTLLNPARSRFAIRLTATTGDRRS